MYCSSEKSSGGAVCSVRKMSSSCSSRRVLKRQWSSEKAANKKQQNKTTVRVANEESGIFPSSENWENEGEPLVGRGDGNKDEDVQMVGVAIDC